jgi:hypothetical protein
LIGCPARRENGRLFPFVSAYNEVISRCHIKCNLPLSNVKSFA